MFFIYRKYFNYNLLTVSRYTFVLLFFIYFNAYSASNWNKKSKEGLHYYLKHQYSDYYNELFKIIEDPNEDLIARESAIDNISALYHKGINYNPPELINSAIERVDVIHSINQGVGYTLNYSLNLEIMSKTIKKFNEIQLFFKSTPTFSFTDKDIHQENTRPHTFTVQSERLNSPLQEGLYTLKIKSDQSTSWFHFYVDSTDQNLKWPPFPKILSVSQNHIKLKWFDYQSSSFLPTRDQRRVIASTSINGQKPNSFFELDANSEKTIQLKVKPEGQAQTHVGISYIESRPWGRLNQIQTLNYLVPIEK